MAAMAASTKDVQKKIDALRDKIRYHEHRYYVLDDPEVSDAAFDKLMDELIALEAKHPELVTPDSPTQRVGGKPSEEFAKVRHSTPMLSLAKTTSEAEVRDWERRVHELSGQSQVDYVCELKLDGMSLALRFKDGQLALGLTRGDGTTGEDVTPNVRTVRSVPLTIADKTLDKAGLPRDFEVRGELLMPLAAFQRMNDEREEKGLPGVCQSAQCHGRHGAHAGAERDRTAAPRFLRLRPARRRQSNLRPPFEGLEGADGGRVQGESAAQAGTQS